MSETKTVLVAPHKKISRDVTNDDLAKVKGLADHMMILAYGLIRDRIFGKVYAIAHPQIDADDPMRFFWLNSDEPLVKENDLFGLGTNIIINPIITRQSQPSCIKSEGCLTFPGRSSINVYRSQKLELTYQVIGESGELESRTAKLSGLGAQILQHEIDHFNARYVYADAFDYLEKKEDKPKK